VEDEAKIVTHMREQAHEKSKIAAEKSAARWLKNKRVKVYEVEERVWVKQKIEKQRKGKIWQRTATIHEVKGNYTYRLKWGSEGGYDSKEAPGSISLRCWSGQDLKPRLISSSSSDSEEYLPSDDVYSSDEEGGVLSWETEPPEEKNDYKEEEKIRDNEEKWSGLEDLEPEVATEPVKKKKRLAKRINSKRPHHALAIEPPQPKPSLSSFYAKVGVDTNDKTLSRVRRNK